MSLALTKVGPPFLTGWVVFYTRRLYQRIEDCFNRPIAGEASARIQVCVRERKGRGDGAPLEMTGEKRDLLNLGSYNYLGFGGVDERCTPAVLTLTPTLTLTLTLPLTLTLTLTRCTPDVEAALHEHGVTAGSSRPNPNP